MNIRLTAANLFIRGNGTIKWLRLVDECVCDTMATLIGKDVVLAHQRTMPSGPKGYRQAMAEKHSELIGILVQGKGTEEAVRQGRQAMYDAGVGLGKRLRGELHLSNDKKQLIAAARLLYRILDIEFEITDDDEMRMIVRRCSMAKGYGLQTCQIISGMDEGVVHGLNPDVSMHFTRMNQGGMTPCEADLVWEGGK